MEKIIIDASNKIVSDLGKNVVPTFAAGTNSLISFIQIWKNNHYYKGKIYIVFDGVGKAIYTENINGIICTYTPANQEADEYIISMVKSDKNPSSIKVISSDNNLKDICEYRGASTNVFDVIVKAAAIFAAGSLFDLLKAYGAIYKGE